MKKHYIFIIIVIILIFLFIMNIHINKDKKENIVINSKIGVVVDKNKISFNFKELEGNNNQYKINKMIPNLKLGDILILKYINNNLSDIDDYILYKNYEVKNSYTLDSYMEQNKKYFIIKTHKEYKKFVLKNNIIDSKKYDNKFFKNNNLYINVKNYINQCPEENIINTYLSENNIIMEVNTNNINCTKKNITKYFIVEAKKNIKKTKLYINKNRVNYYKSYKSNNNINIYVWRKNNIINYGLINDKDLKEGKSNILYMKAMPLSLNEMSFIFNNYFSNDSVKIIGEIPLSNRQLDLIKKEIGDEN